MLRMNYCSVYHGKETFVAFQQIARRRGRRLESLKPRKLAMSDANQMSMVEL